MAQTEIHDMFVIGLRNAYAMENQALGIMRPQLSRLEHYPEVAAKIEQHIDETEDQISRLEHILKDMDANYLDLKDMILSYTTPTTVMSYTGSGDAVLKDAFGDFAFENYEIATYKSLLTIADAGNFGEAKSALQESLVEEQAMAKWLDDNLPAVTRKFLLMWEQDAPLAHRA
ncbi:ferritin-like domain-containing protein [Agrobacterium rhizogenes]|nr:ferritin-like domain-containing protein [Rhizobium rhizogenes]NTJ77648.1 ferritin-like domain-containing protein [Rhizobium rhizogenes]